jgi:hypothetical protein
MDAFSGIVLLDKPAGMKLGKGRRIKEENEKKKKGKNEVGKR